MVTIEKADYFRVLADIARCFEDSGWVNTFKALPMDMAVFFCWELVDCPSGTTGIELSTFDVSKMSNKGESSIGFQFQKLATICLSFGVTEINVLDVLSEFHGDIEDTWNSTFVSEPREDAIFFRPRPNKAPSNSEEAMENMVIPCPLAIAAEVGFERGQEL